MIMRARKKLLLVLLTAFAALMILVSHRLLPWPRKGTDESHESNKTDRMNRKAFLASLLQNRPDKGSSSTFNTIIAQKKSLTMFVDQRGSPKRTVVFHGAREKATNDDRILPELDSKFRIGERQEDDRISEKNTNVKRSQLRSHQEKRNSLNGKTRSELSASQQQPIVKMDDSGVAAELKGVSAGHKSGVEISYEGPALNNTGNFGLDEFANDRADRMAGISNQDENLQKNPVANSRITQAAKGRIMERTDNPKAVSQQNAKGIVTSSPLNTLLTASFDLTSDKKGVLNLENFEPVVDDQGDEGIGNLDSFLGQVEPNAVTALRTDDKQGDLNPESSKPFLVEGIPADIAVDALSQQGTGKATNMSFIHRQQGTGNATNMSFIPRQQGTGNATNMSFIPGQQSKPFLVDRTHGEIPADIAVNALSQQGTGNATNMSFIHRQQGTGNATNMSFIPRQQGTGKATNMSFIHRQQGTGNATNMSFIPRQQSKPFLVDRTYGEIPADIAVDALSQQSTGNATNMSFIHRQQGTGNATNMSFIPRQEGTGKATNTTSVKLFTPSTQEVHHLFFLKVHKAASTTVLNIVYRFSLSRRLVVLLPTPTMANILSEHTKNWVPSAAPLPPGADHFDVMCNHVVYEETSIRRMLPEDTVFVGIVRRPFDQFVSAFWYYREMYRFPYLTRIPGERPVSTYLQDPARWEPDPRKMEFTNNRMSVDFGMDPTKVHDEVYVKNYLRYLGRTFPLVMVSDRFDESILLMRRLLGWKVEDVIYTKNNARKGNLYNQTFTAKEKQTHRDFNFADYALYEHFSRVLDDKVRAAGEALSREVESFQQICRSVRGYCHSNATEPLKVQAILWREDFSVTKETCALLTMDEMKFVKIMRKNNGKKV